MHADNRKNSAKYLAELNALAVGDAEGMIDNVYLTSHGDNQNFFGLNSAYKGQKGSDIYEKMNRKFVEIGDAENGSLEKCSIYGSNPGCKRQTPRAEHAAEIPKLSPSTPAETTAPAIATKPSSINFATGQYQLTENAKTIIDLQFAEIAKSFAN